MNGRDRNSAQGEVLPAVARFYALLAAVDNDSAASSYEADKRILDALYEELDEARRALLDAELDVARRVGAARRLRRLRRREKDPAGVREAEFRLRYWQDQLRATRRARRQVSRALSDANRAAIRRTGREIRKELATIGTLTAAAGQAIWALLRSAWRGDPPPVMPPTGVPGRGGPGSRGWTSGC